MAVSIWNGPFVNEMVIRWLTARPLIHAFIQSPPVSAASEPGAPPASGAQLGMNVPSLTVSRLVGKLNRKCS